MKTTESNMKSRKIPCVKDILKHSIWKECIYKNWQKKTN